MRDTTIQNNRGIHAAFDGGCAGFQLGDHAACDGAIGLKLGKQSCLKICVVFAGSARKLSI